ncbi:hypothetical protein [Dethiothermospora halolimnae]
MDGKDVLKKLYREFGEEPKDNENIKSVSNIMYEMGTKEKEVDLEEILFK